MKAVRIHSYGGPEELVYEDAPVPDAEEGEILVCVHAAGVNPADRQIRAGLRQRREGRFSLTLGLEVSGVVAKVGPGAAGFGVGDPVYGLVMAMGGYAEFIAGPAANFAPKPRSLDHVHAAATPVTGLTAWQALFEVAGLLPGQKVLIHAAAGGVGHMAVQFAKWRRAYVIGTASAKNEAFLLGLGVDEFIDYQATAFESVVDAVDVVLDAVPREVDDHTDAVARETVDRSWGVLKDGGILVSVCAHAAPDEAATERGVRGRYWLAESRRDHLEQIAGLVDDGYVKPVVSAVLPLDQARRAHELIQTGHTQGKIVLRVSDGR